MTDPLSQSSSPTFTELLALWLRLTPDAQASLLRIARAKAASVEPTHA